MLNNVSTLSAEKYESQVSTAVPSSCISSKLTLAEYAIKSVVGDGKELVFKDDDGCPICINIQFITDGKKLKRSAPLSLVSQHGIVQMYSYCSFLQTVSGMPIDSDVILSDELVYLMLSRLPKPLVDIFGWLAPQDNDTITLCDPIVLLLRLTEGEISRIVLVEANRNTWMGILNNPSLQAVDNGVEPIKVDIPTPIILGKSLLSISEYNQLEVGDVLIFDDALFDCEGIGKVDIGKQQYNARIFFDEVTQESKLTLLEHLLDEDEIPKENVPEIEEHENLVE